MRTVVWEEAIHRKVKPLSHAELKTLFLNVQTVVSIDMGLPQTSLCMSCCHETPLKASLGITLIGRV